MINVFNFSPFRRCEQIICKLRYEKYDLLLRAMHFFGKMLTTPARHDSEICSCEWCLGHVVLRPSPVSCYCYAACNKWTCCWKSRNVVSRTPMASHVNKESIVIEMWIEKENTYGDDSYFHFSFLDCFTIYQLESWACWTTKLYFSVFYCRKNRRFSRNLSKIINKIPVNY